MVKGVFVSAVLGICAAMIPDNAASAQGGSTGSFEVQLGGAQETPRNFQDMLFKDIELSAEQKAKIDSINTKYRARTDSMRKANAAAGKRVRDTGVMRGKGQHVRTRGTMSPFAAEREAEVLAVLTDEQKETYEANKAKFEKRMKEGSKMKKGKDGSIRIEGLEIKMK